MKRGTPRHRKMRDLARRLGIPLAHAVGIMEMIWHWAGQETPEGDLGIASDREIAAAVDWDGKPARLVECLTESGWLDADPTYRLIIHDWPDHAESAVKKWLQRNGRDFLPVYGKSAGQSPDTVQPPYGQTEEEFPARARSQAKPSQAKPNAQPSPASQPFVNGSSDPGGWPLTRAWLAETGAGPKLIDELIASALKELPSITDQDLLNSLILARKPNQRSPGLFRQTLPELIREEVRRFKAAGGELP